MLFAGGVQGMDAIAAGENDCSPFATGSAGRFEADAGAAPDHGHRLTTQFALAGDDASDLLCSAHRNLHLAVEGRTEQGAVAALFEQP